MKRIGAALLALMMLVTAGEAFAADTQAEAAAAPEWADVKLNSRGFIDEGEYVFEDNENGHWMYVSPSLRIEIVRTLETPEKKKKSPWSFMSRGYLLLVLLFIYLPIAYVVVFSFNDSKSMTKFAGFSLRWYESMLNDRTMLESIRTTVVVAVIATAVSTAVGTVTAIGLSKARPLIRSAVLEVNNLPVLNPDIVTAIGMMLLFIVPGIQLSMTTLIIAHITFCIPYVILTIAFSMSFDDFVISFFTAGVGVNNISMYVYSMKRYNPSVNALSTLIVVVVTIILILVNLIPYIKDKKTKKEEQRL